MANQADLRNPVIAFIVILILLALACVVADLLGSEEQQTFVCGALANFVA